MKTLVTPLALAIVLATGLGASPSAQASDDKTISPAVCQPYSTTTLPSELSFRAHGLKNISSNAEHVVCSITVDFDVATTGASRNHWTDAEPAEVKILVHATSAGTASCELYMGSNLVGETISMSNYQEFAANQVKTILFGPVSSGTLQWLSFGTRPPVSLFCRMPPGSSIIKIELREQGNTDS